MTVLKTKAALENRRSGIPPGKQIGLVPTMGALHQGHLALVKRALAENDYVFISIFVNPTQFNNTDDLKKYPKTLEADVTLLNGLSTEIMVFAPSVEEIYASNIQAKNYDFGPLETVMEGAFREGHFDGVGTIVETLFRLVKPHNAYFGEKDYQQLQIIKKMAAQRNLPVQIVGCPIVREKGGLALSSRNERLPKRLRKEASFIYKTLLAAKKKFGTKSAGYVVNWVTSQFKKHKDLRLEYIEIAEAETLVTVKRKKKDIKYRAFIAVYADDVRLIDNIALN
ncbi:MAG: pantoate--beta-alanine ligase [Flavobacteriaceae bacterium]